MRPHRVVTVVGLAKNAGKTTVVNALVRQLEGRLGLASLGLDGEERDQLTGLPKPRISPPEGTLIATTEGLLPERGVRVVERLGLRTAAGDAVIAEVAEGTQVVVAGPTRLEELDEALAALRRLGAARVVLEGALGRLGTAAPQRADAVVVAAGAALANGRADHGLKLRLALDLLDLPVDATSADLRVEHAAGFESELAADITARGASVVEIDGAVTGPLVERLLRRRTPVRLIAPDATHVLAGPQQVARARRGGVEVCVRRPLPVVAVTASPFHPDVAFTADEAFATTVAAVAGRWPVFDVVSGRMQA
jgi:hypothetical protein